MGFVQLLTSLWPFLKEMIVGEKIKDPSSSKDDTTKTKRNPAQLAAWVITKMQSSRRFCAFIMVVLILSLFMNYKAVIKAAVLPVRQEDGEPIPTTPIKEPKEAPTAPKDHADRRKEIYEDTVKELHLLYGGKV